MFNSRLAFDHVCLCVYFHFWDVVGRGRECVAKIMRGLCRKVDERTQIHDSGKGSLLPVMLIREGKKQNMGGKRKNPEERE